MVNEMIKIPKGWVYIEWIDELGNKWKDTMPLDAYKLNPNLQLRARKVVVGKD